MKYKKTILSTIFGVPILLGTTFSVIACGSSSSVDDSSSGVDNSALLTKIQNTLQAKDQDNANLLLPETDDDSNKVNFLLKFFKNLYFEKNTDATKLDTDVITIKYYLSPEATLEALNVLIKADLSVLTQKDMKYLEADIYKYIQYHLNGFFALANDNNSNKEITNTFLVETNQANGKPYFSGTVTGLKSDIKDLDTKFAYLHSDNEKFWKLIFRLATHKNYLVSPDLFLDAEHAHFANFSVPKSYFSNNLEKAILVLEGEFPKLKSQLKGYLPWEPPIFDIPFKFWQPSDLVTFYWTARSSNDPMYAKSKFLEEYTFKVRLLITAE